MKLLAVLALTIVLFARPADADIYLVRGAEGEVSFTDIALPDAVVVDLDVYQPSAQQADSVRRSLEQTVAVAAELEAARRARTRERQEKTAQAAQRAARRAPEPPEPVYRRLVSSAPGYFVGYPPSHMRPHGPRERMMPEPVQPPSVGKRFLQWPGRRRGR